ncbi:MAG: hypothetical protein GY847_11885 [Proteobacteria bacterium]|nr:hypothetical protein [Pseudomonadota bacterium]
MSVTTDAICGHQGGTIRGRTGSAEPDAGDGRRSPLDGLDTLVYSGFDGGSRTIMVAPLSFGRYAA